MSDSLQPYWTIVSQAPLSMGFSMQEYLHGLPCPSPGTLSNPGIELASLISPAFARMPPWKPYKYTVAAVAQSLQSCPALCDPTDGSPPGSAVPGILQARTLEWVASAFSNALPCIK